MGASQRAASALEDFTSETIDAQYVERRWRDWNRRVRTLYKEVGQWLAPELSCKEGPEISFQEELMKSAGVSAKKLVSLDIFDGTRRVGGLKPFALWVIGNNGRIDVESPGGPHMIVDVAGKFEPPEWQIGPITSRRRLERLGRANFRRLFI